MHDCPVHGPRPDDADPFDDAVAAMMTIYLMSREVTPDFAGGEALVTVHAHLDDDPDIFTLKIGLGHAAHVALDAERCARAAERDDEPAPYEPITNADLGWESGTCADPRDHLGDPIKLSEIFDADKRAE
jgi:hypothetical protein